MGDRGHNKYGPKEGAAVGDRAGSPSNNMAWAEAYLPTKWHLDPSNRLAAIMTQAENWGCAPF